MAETISVELRFNETFKGFLARSPLQFEQDCLKEADFCSYEFGRSMNEPNLPSIFIEQSGQRLTLKNVVAITTSSNMQASSEIDNFQLTVRGLPDDSSHEENKAFIYAIIETIKSNGWSRLISPTSPRVSGSQAEKIHSADTVHGVYISSHPWFDPDYTLDMERWMKWGSFYSWDFYNNGLYMTLNAWRQKSQTEPQNKGTYLITLELQTDAKYWKKSFETEEQQRDWISLIPELKNKYITIRSRDEKTLRAAGIAIDEDYQDPPIKALEKQ